MGRLWKLMVGIVLLLILAACGSGAAQQGGSTGGAKIPTALPGMSSILVPATLSPYELTPQAIVGPSASEVEINLYNQGSWNVCYVYIASPDEDTWGKDWLVKDEMIESGMYRVFKVKPGTYDLRAETCDYVPLYEVFKADLTQAWDWTVGDPATRFEEYFDKDVPWKVSGAGSAAVKDSTYHLSTGSSPTLVTALAGQSFEDAVVTSEGTLVQPEGSTTTAYGVMCRAQPNGDGYAFLLRNDGKYSIAKVAGGKLSALVDWKTTDMTFVSQDLNVVEGRCAGSELKIRINGITVDKATDSTYKSGDVGLAVLPGGAAAEVKFDNFLVTEP